MSRFARKAIVGATLAMTLALASCSSGPRRLSRNWDEWVNQKYTQDSWIHGALLQDIIPVYPVVRIVMVVGDWLVVNPYYFWRDDAWEGNGTAYIYDQPEGAVRSVSGWGGESDDDGGDGGDDE